MEYHKSKGRYNMKVRYFKKTKNGVLDAIGRAETEKYAAKLINEGFEEISKERYIKLIAQHLYISYRIE